MGIQDIIALLFVVAVAGLAARSVWQAVRRGRTCGSCPGGGCQTKRPIARSAATYHFQPLVTISFNGSTAPSDDAAYRAHR